MSEDIEQQNEIIILENKPQVLDTVRCIIKNNPIQLIGFEEAISNILYVNIMVKYKDKAVPIKVDLDDYNKFLRFYTWSGHKCTGNIYAETGKTVSKYKKETIKMHRFILEQHGYDLTGKIIDHISGDTTDNRLTNLRIGDYVINAVNRRPYAKMKKDSKYKGVCKESYNGKWRASVTYQGDKYYLGQYDSEREAALAYNQKLVELLGHSNVYLNKIT